MGIDYKDANNIYIPDTISDYSGCFSNLVQVGNEIYFGKFKSSVHELIGSYLAKKINFESVDYRPAVFEK